ncbi:2-polyprenyl-6-methoxyphenol hydroxylase [Micromonospora matsumotoense]|uniref:2-polyprenyl-6-methoxyphenol hydroxylase n=1 Tax=Micromonospora matsumotoense TaxID=121616 RepID=A0A1C5A276_9ACTN|nr:FAD-dependent monooxygenase [Micromonospora matsumotoense]SCF39315.1 2-polyprenyl-6-methoxyphenol hydroxylase [Micromonospora matsumotoense]
MTVDVAIVGCGPVGAFLAGELRLAGVRVVVLERSVEPTVHSRAFRLQTRTLELLDYRGLLDRFVANAIRIPKTHFAAIRPPLLDLDLLDTEHPYTLGIPQARTEAYLVEHAAGLGAEIRRGHEITGLEQTGDGVVLQVNSADGPYSLTAAYVVGCDGGRSLVRKAAGIGFPGVPGTVSALLGDVTLGDPDAFPSGIPGTLRTRSGLIMAVAMPDTGIRVFTCEFDRPVPDRDAPVSLDELRAAATRVTGLEIEMSEPTWLARFTDSSRLVDRFHSGRVFVAGDAAHVHFPIGAQGLNLGIQDAMNLGWKLAGQIHGWAPGDLLDSYDRERRPAADRVILETRAQLALMNSDERIDPLREVFRELLAIDEVNRHLSRMLTGLDARYQPEPTAAVHPLVGRLAPPLRLRTAAGPVRLAELLRTGRPVLVDLGDEPSVATAAAGHRDRVDVIAAREEDGATVGALLIRPDGYVAWAAAPDVAPAAVESSLPAALAAWFGLATAAVR